MDTAEAETLIQVMDPLALSTVADDCGGRLLQGRPSDRVTGVSTDSRAIERGELFVALKGERFDGHDYLKEVARRGAGAVLVSKLPPDTERIACGIILVHDTLKALQRLAKRYRDRRDLTVVAITGSSGKTSTKDFLGSVLGRRHEVNATRGNLNNHIGLPLTMLRTERRHTCGVWELGMSHPGEIEFLAELASPDIGVITNVGTAHIEFMKTRDAIAQEKGMLAEAISRQGCLVLSADDDYVESIRARTSARVLTAGLERGDLRARNIRCDADGCSFELQYGGERVDAFIPVSGKHMIRNALLAAAVGLHLGLTAEETIAGLRDVRLAAGRLEKKIFRGITFLDDSYNANPDSVRAAIDTLKDLECAGKRIAVLGAMAELGDASAQEHRSIGMHTAACGIDVLVTVGAQARLIADGAEGMETHSFEAHEEAAAWLVSAAAEGDLVLVKGSRSSRMEKVLEGVTAA